MHVLLTNDDGPLNDLTSPYIKYLVDAIEQYTDWTLSIVVPNTQRSWIGKAHFAGKDLTASFIYPTGEGNTFKGPFPTPQPELIAQGATEWCLLDGTPASCADIGVHHLYSEKGPVDLVISGPNFGRNSTALYITSSGTIGAAMEAALTNVKSIGLSYAFESREVDPVVTAEAAKISVKLIQHLYDSWPAGEVDLYSINVPLISSLKLNETKIHYAPILPNRWGSIFTSSANSNKGDLETDIVDSSSSNQIQFKWTPDFHAVHNSVLASKDKNEHNDGVVLLDGGISVTPLRAIFKDVGISGEIKLDECERASEEEQEQEAALISIDQHSYIYPIIESSIKNHLPSLKIIHSKDAGKKCSKLFQYGEYEDLDFDRVMADPNYLINSFVYRKSLIRKHYLSHTIHSYVVKNPNSILTRSFPETFNIEVDYAEFLEDALDEVYDLKQELEKNEKFWILKPSMSDRGQGIRIFKTIDQLQEIFDGFEEEDTDDEGEFNYTEDNHGIITSQLRHFVVQEYMMNPLLLPCYNNKKFHFRTYVVVNGSMKVYVFKKMLTLFALSSYKKPTEDGEGVRMFGHLTNTCLQGEKAIGNNSVVEFWELDSVTKETKTDIFDKICEIVKELFKAAISVDRLNFQPLDNAFEIFGLDFIIDDQFNVQLLEVNSYPDFKQTGEELKTLINELFDSVVRACVVPFFDKQATLEEDELLVKVLDQDTNGW